MDLDQRLDPPDDTPCFECAMAELRAGLSLALPGGMSFAKAELYISAWASEAREDVWEAGGPWRACKEHRSE